MPVYPPLGAPRRRWPILLAVPALVLPMLTGCSHKRTALRPVFAAPVVGRPVVTPAPCPSGNCGSATTVSPGFEDGGISPAPSFAPSARPISPSKIGPDSEPMLEQRTPTSTGRPTSELPPATSRRTRRGASRRTALRTAVEPFVNDPDDLFAPPKADRPWKYVVVHHSATPAGSYAQIDRDHRQARGFTGCGYHFVIGNGTETPDGQIEVANRWAEQKGGAHCRDGKSPDVNEYGIGICLIGNFDNTQPTPRQVQATRALLSYLQDRYAIPAAKISTHADVAQGPTACPGSQFPTDAILVDRDLASR